MQKFTRFVLALALVAGVTSATYGQVIEPGNTLYSLRGIYSPEQAEYQALVLLNPFLAEEGRNFVDSNGRFIVIIRPGEELRGVREIAEAEGVVAINDRATEAQVVVPEEAEASSGWPWYVWALIALAVTAVLYGLWRARWVLRNPVTSGAPMVSGGISPDQTEAIEARFQTMANQRHLAANPAADLGTSRPRRVSDIEEGTLTGVGRVQYRDRVETRRLNREPAFRADFEFPDGHVEELHFLQGCANDVTYSGMRYLGFRFEPGRSVAPAPAPPQPPAPVPAPMRTVAGAQQVAFVHKGMELIFPAGTTIMSTGQEVRINTSGPAQIVVRKKVQAARSRRTATTSAATGTDSRQGVRAEDFDA